jgi:membrane fusion protein (multidrug efflux system)
MAKINKRGMAGILIIIVVLVVAGVYLIGKRSPDRVAAADSTAVDTTAVDSTAASAEGEEAEGEDEKKEPDPVPVEIAEVRPREISAYYYTTASLEPEKKVNILAKIAGQVEKLYVEEGARVAAGDILCQLEDAALRNTLEEARINRDRQKREYDRLKTMFDENIVSDREFTEAKYQYEIAENSYEAAAIQYEYARIKAPFGGVITKRHVDIGQNIGVGTELFEIVDPSPLLVRMYMPENEIKDITVGLDVTIQPDNDPDNKLIGRIVRIAPEVDERTGTVKVTAETRGRAMPGSFARIKIATDTRQGSLTIPRRGLISDAGELYVYVAETDTVRRSSVTIGYQDEEYAEVLSGVVEGDSVVVLGVGGLRTGTKIKVLEPNMQNQLMPPTEDEEDGDTASN